MARFRRRRSTRLVPLTVIASGGARREEHGGKAFGLAQALQLGLPVPETWVIPATAFREAVRSDLPPGHTPAELIRFADRPAALERAAAARDEILKLELPTDVLSDLAELADEVEGNSPWGLAVRSSATCEDAGLTSMAGIAETVLGARTAEELADAVRRVWASGVSGDALAYLRAHKVKDVAVAVVIQRVVAAKAAGVMFTRDPQKSPSATGAPLRVEVDKLDERRVRVVSATFGLGAPLVDGTSHPDTLRFDENGEVIEYLTANKAEKLVVGDDGISCEPVPENLREHPALGPAAIAELAEIARVLDADGGGAYDVEFAVGRRGGVRVLQLRPVTGLGYPDGGDASTVWSRAVLGESLEGVPTPLTWSVLAPLAEKNFRSAFYAFGSRVPKGARFVGRVHGRFYFNMSAFMQGAAQVPGVEPRTLLELAAGEGRTVLERQIEQSKSKRSLARLPFTVARLFTEQARLGDELARFERSGEKFARWLAEMDLGILPDDALTTTLREVRGFVEQTGRLSLRCSAAALAAHLGLKTVLARSTPVTAEHVAQAMTAGVGDLETATAGVALAHVVAIAHKDAEARAALLARVKLLDGNAPFGEPALFGETAPLDQAALPDQLPDGPAKRAILQFLEAYGDRGINESELITPRWREDPSTLLSIVAAGLRGEPVDPDRALSMARALAEGRAHQVEERLPYIERALVRALVARYRRFTRLRARMRVWLMRTLGMLRTVALDVDRRLRRIDDALRPGAAFFLTFDEMVDAISRSRSDLAPLVRLRAAGWQRDSSRPDPPGSFVGAPPSVAFAPSGGAVLHGLPGSGGVVTGRARVLGSGLGRAATLEPGEVLVTRTIDVGASPLFLVAAGVVTELGSPLSHAAIVARELGVPAVVAAAGVTRLVRDGERLRVDGDRGIVERLDA